jgi:Holliday junction DNA helicase RuvA
MIARIQGTLASRSDSSVVVDVSGVGYEVLVPAIVAKALEAAELNTPIALETIYYLQIDGNRASPILLGFENTIQKEFFEKLILVPRMGPKSALGMFARPVSTLAVAIETANTSLLKSLPGVGPQKVRDIIATLQGKLAKFALMQDADLDKRAARALAGHADVPDEAIQLLTLLGHKRAEAERMVHDALSSEPGAPDAESLVRVIYRRQQEKK